jgi:hypothetical protein
MIIDGTNGLTFNNATTQASAGVVLQVQSAVYSSLTGSSSSTMANTGLTVSITPKFATSKILVMANMNGCGKDASNTTVRLAIVRDSTIICPMNDILAYTNSTATTYGSGGASATYLDSPATTSATTYKVQFASTNNTATVYINNYQVTSGNSASTITVMEIAQ